MMNVKTKTLLHGLLLGGLLVAVFAVIGILSPSVRGNVEFAIQQTADAPFGYAELAEAPEAVPVNAGRFQLSRILQQFQARSGNTFRLWSLRELCKAIQELHSLLLPGVIGCCCYLRASLRSKQLFHLYLNSITPCRAGPSSVLC
ncbi:MAG: hypothetical protein J6C40_01715 [Lentisphaeria bacterium]|nr:hypothetical protein [Lentisphaeria bacterium]